MASSSVRLAHIVAHQGGWDEILLVAGPIVLIVALLAIVKRRVDRVASETAETARTAEAAADRDEPDHVRDGG